VLAEALVSVVAAGPALSTAVRIEAATFDPAAAPVDADPVAPLDVVDPVADAAGVGSVGCVTTVPLDGSVGVGGPWVVTTGVLCVALVAPVAVDEPAELIGAAGVDGGVVALAGVFVALAGVVVAIDGVVVALAGVVVAIDGVVVALDGVLVAIDGVVVADGAVIEYDDVTAGIRRVTVWRTTCRTTRWRTITCRTTRWRTITCRTTRWRTIRRVVTPASEEVGACTFPTAGAT
jgi:hypothetical protein